MNEKAAADRQDYLQDVEKLKTDIRERYSTELQQKSQESLRNESILHERIGLLEKDLSRVEVDLLQNK